MSNISREMQDLYRELVLEHSRSPRHFGRLEDATHTADGINPLCGDKLKLYLRINEAGEIESSSFEGTGCAISVASASLLTDSIAGMAVAEARECSSAVTQQLSSCDPSTGLAGKLDRLRALDGVRHYPSRVKCATLAWTALRSALDNDTTPATTE